MPKTNIRRSQILISLFSTRHPKSLWYSKLSLMARKPHAVVVPYPAQGHVAPLTKLALKLANYGIKVTFVIADLIHDKVMASLPEKLENIPISIVSVSAGFGAKLDMKDRRGIMNSIIRIMPGNLQRLIETINSQNNDEKVCCVVADIAAWWAIDVAMNMGIKAAAVVPFGAWNLTFVLNAPKLIEAGIIDVDGIPFRDEFVYVTKEAPRNTKELFWSMPGEAEAQKFIFNNFILKAIEAVKICDWILINSFYELEQSAYDMIPHTSPIGPLFTSNDFSVNLWPPDSTCLNWLDQQPENSVIYAAFGSTGMCTQQQFHELACAFELIGKPFLWVVRSNFTKEMAAELPDGFMERVANYGKIVEWAPQEKVLAHPSIACFFSHCGWNSTIEGVSLGVPFLCWPYFVDQFGNSSYICDTWKVGLRVIPEENGIVSRHQVKAKIEELLSHKDIKINSLKLKQMAAISVGQGGSSFNNFISFIEAIKQ